MADQQSYNLNPQWLPNPSDSMLELNGVGKLPTVLSNQAAATRQNLAAPFIQMAQQGMGNNLQNDMMAGQEFRSAPWQQARLAEQQANIAKAQGTIADTPLNTKLLQDKVRASGPQTDLAIAESQDKLGEVKDAPRKRLAQRLAPYYEELSKIQNPMQQSLKYNQIVQQLADEADTPEKKSEVIRKFGNPAMGMNILKSAYNEHINNSEFMQKKNLEDVQGQWHVKAAGVSAGATVQAAQIAAKSHEKIAELQIAAPKQQAAIVGNARKTVADPNADATQKAVAIEVLKASVEQDVIKEVTARQIELLQGKTSVDKIRAEHYQRAGIYGMGEPNPNPNPQSTPPAPGNTPEQVGTASPPPNIRSLGDLKKLYPNQSDEALRKAFKSKYGIDLK